MEWIIAADSSSNWLDHADYTKWGIGVEVAPLKIGLEGEEYVDDAALDLGQFIPAMEAAAHSNSAAPSTQAWKNAFDKGDKVIAITITSKLSGSYSSAYAARQMVLEQHPEKQIFILDSLSTGPEMVLLIERCAQLIREGRSFDEVCEELSAYSKKTNLMFILGSLDNLIKNGRVSKLEGSLAGLLGIKVLGCAKEGVLDVLKKCRGKQVFSQLLVQMEAFKFNGRRLIISHCENEARANEIQQSVLASHPDCQVTIMENRGLCTYYAQRGGILVGFESI